MYETPAELLRAIAGGEDSYLELKEVRFEGRGKLVLDGEGQASPWLSRQVSAFTNTDGGVLVLGVADSKEVVGIDPERLGDLQLFVLDVARDKVEPPADHLLRLDAMVLGEAGAERTVLRVDIRPDYFAVHAPKSRRPYTRSGNRTVEVSMELLPRLLARRGSLISADERPVLSSTADDLDWGRIGRYHEERFHRPLVDRERFGRNLKLLQADELGTDHASVAGLLLFGVEPQRHLPQARIDLIAYAGVVPDTDARRDTRSFTGPVTAQIAAAVDYLERSPSIQTWSQKNDSGGRTDHPAYSLRALEECVVNAVAHRDYAILGGQIRVQLFADRIEVTSPGRLPNSLVPEDLFAGAQPIRRNQVLVGFLVEPATSGRDRALMDSQGEGFLTMARETERISGRLPEVRVHTEAVTVTVPAALADPSSSGRGIA